MERIKLAVVAGFTAFVLSFSMIGAPVAYAAEGQLQSATVSSLSTQSGGTTPGGETPAAQQPATDQTATQPAASTLKKGSVVTAGKNATKAKYKVKNLKKKTVVYQKCLAPKKAVKIPATVKINGQKFKVVAVAAKAVKGKKKVNSLTVGKNVTTIGKSAFAKTPKLKTIKVATKNLKKKGVKQALKGSSIKTVKVPKAKVKAYKKIFTKKVCGKKVKVTK